MRTKNLFLLLSAGCLIQACEKDINVNLHQQEEKIVIDGKIENGRYPHVVLSNSLDYYAKISVSTLLKSFVHNAEINVSNGKSTMKLKEYTEPIAPGISLYHYSVDSSALNTAFKGEFNASYSLEIKVAGKVYKANTTIPANSMVLDSAWWRRARVNDDTSFARLAIKVTDPPAPGNYARYFTKRNTEPYLPGLTSVLDDQVVNGTSFDLSIDAGVDRTKKLDKDTYSYFKRGDTVTIKFCNIDKNTYDFWRTLDYAYVNTGNPFASPVQIIGNIPGALGYWGGYAAAYKTIRIKK